MATILITGANRGLGLDFCRQYAQDNWQVIACCRQPENATELNQLAAQYKNVSVFALDMDDFSQIEQLAVKLSDMSIDVLLNNAGVYGDDAAHRFGNLDYQTWQHTLSTNVFAPVKMIETFLPHVARSEQKKVVAMSSLMGSIADNTSGGSILYRSSKSALNAAMKSIAIELQAKHIAVLILHPGWVRTDMGGSNAPMEIPQSVSHMRDTIANFTLAQTGEFQRYDGKVLPW